MENIEANRPKPEPTRIPVTGLRYFIADFANRAKYTQERFLITRHGEDLMAMVSMEDLERLEQSKQAELEGSDSPE